jgi:hypothetical protein
MPNPIVEFIVHGSPRAVSQAIESYAAERRVVTVLVVPWESTAARLSMAVTSSRADGWSIEHTNLGTIVLSDVHGTATEVAVFPFDPPYAAAAESGRAGADRSAGTLDAFARQIKQRFESTGPRAEQTP